MASTCARPEACWMRMCTPSWAPECSWKSLGPVGPDSLSEERGERLNALSGQRVEEMGRPRNIKGRWMPRQLSMQASTREPTKSTIQLTCMQSNWLPIVSQSPQLPIVHLLFNKWYIHHHHLHHLAMALCYELPPSIFPRPAALHICGTLPPRHVRLLLPESSSSFGLIYVAWGHPPDREQPICAASEARMQEVFLLVYA
jgi:hypothetical protein